MFTPPTELLVAQPISSDTHVMILRAHHTGRDSVVQYWMHVAQPISSPTQKLLGSYVTQSRALRSQSVLRSKYSEGGGLAAVTEFYGASGQIVIQCIQCVTVAHCSIYWACDTVLTVW